jgi:predicted nucleic acid-binding protein
VTRAPALSGIQRPSPTTFIIDTSVAIQWYLQEIYQSEAQRFLDPVFDRHAPDLLHAELGSVLLKKVRKREINVDECRTYLSQLSAVPLMSHEALPLRQVALEIGLQIGSSLYDGLFLALALLLGGRLVTADRKLYRKIQSSPFDPWSFWIADSL